MGNFRKDNKFGGGRSSVGRGGFGGGRNSGGRGGFGGGDRDRERPTMHKAVCDECGQTCEVPFRPSGDKPIYCSNCFEDRGGNESRNFDRKERRPSFGDNRAERQMYSVKCDDCGKTCEVPFRPSSDKPVYCDSCFSKNKNGSSAGGKGNEDLKNQLDSLNIKLDKILKILSGSSETIKTEKAEKVEIEKPKTKKKEEAVEIVLEEKKVEKKEKKEKPAKKAPAKKVVAKKKK